MQPSSSQTAELKSIELIVVPNDKPVKHGRPLRLTPRKFVKICHLIQTGLSVTAACEAESVTYQIFRFRVSKSPRLEERFKKAERIRADVRHERALASVLEAGEKSWVAHAWYLERSRPDLWALRSVTRDNPDDKPAETELPAEVLARHRALMLELAREDEARQVQAVQIEDRPKEAVRESNVYSIGTI